MTSDRDFKHLVRARMVETGENYTSARAALIADRAAAQRYFDKTKRSFFRDGRLVAIPAKRRARVVVLLELLRLFEPGREYPEKQVNQILGDVHDDVAYLRRELVDYGLMVRTNAIYRIAEFAPEPGSAVVGELPTDMGSRFAEATRPRLVDASAGV